MVTPFQPFQGGYRVKTRGEWFFNHGQMYHLRDGAKYGGFTEKPILTEDSIISLVRNRISAYHTEPEVEEVTVTDRLERHQIRKKYSLREKWDVEPSEKLSDIFIKAGTRLYGVTEDGKAAAVELPSGEITWKAPVEGEVWAMLAAFGRLFIVTVDGTIYCYGGEERDYETIDRRPVRETEAAGEWKEKAKELPEATIIQSGYALAFGVQLELLEALAHNSGMNIIAFDTERERVNEQCRRLDEEGLYGTRIAVHHTTDFHDVAPPPYLADLMIFGDRYAGKSEKTRYCCTYRVSGRP